MATLRDDRFYAYAGIPVYLDVLANDDLSGLNGTPILSGTTFDSNLVNLGTAFQITLDPILGSVGNAAITYTVSGVSGSAFVAVFGLDGTDGLGGFYYRESSQSEDGGIYTIDLDAMIDPSGTGGYSITSFSVSTQIIEGVYADLNNGVISLDLDQFSKLTAGQSDLATISIGTSNGGQTAESTIAFYVTGANDTVTTITSASGNGDMNGTGGNDLISSVLNQNNAMFGGRGADTFLFKTDHNDGNSDKNSIVDYQVGRDSIEFASGTTIQYMFEFDGGVMLILDGGKDTVFIHGDNVNLDNLDMSGAAYRSADISGGEDPLDPATFDYFLYEYGQTNATFSDSLGYGFGGIYGVNIDFG